MADNRTDKEESLRRSTGDYLQRVLGDGAYTALREIWDESRIPPVAGGLFNLYDTTVRGLQCIAATPKDGVRLPPVRLKHQMDTLAEFFKRSVFYASRDFRPHDAQRMMKLGIPFVCPGRHLHLPFAGAVLTLERKGDLPSEMRGRLGHFAQMYVIGHLLGRFSPGATIGDVAKSLDCSPISVIKVFDELEMLQFGTRFSPLGSRKISFRFAYPRCELWRMARPLMESPFRHIVAVEEEPDDCRTFSIPWRRVEHPKTFAVYEEEFRKSKCQRAPLKGADVVLLLWSYPPDFFTDGEGIDSLSMTLAANTCSDEEINQLLSRIGNSID